MRPNIPTRRALPVTAAIAAIALAACTPDVTVSTRRVRISDADRPGQRTVSFDLSWRDAFHDSVTWNAAWVFIKYRLDGGPWTHGTLSPLASDHTADPPLTIVPTQDARGVLIHRAEVGRGPVNARRIHLAWDAVRDGMGPDMAAEVRVFALDMVRVPSEPFYLGDGEIGNVAGHFRAADRNVPFPLASEDSIVLGGTAPGALANGNAYGMTTPDDFDEVRTRTLPASFPKGVRAFYLMRHELTERQYADFLNTLTPIQQRARNPARGCERSSFMALCGEEPPQPGVHRYGLSAVPPFFSLVPTRPAHYLSWMDAAAYADWAGLRPFTELEYEKAARGPRYPEPGTYAWGTTRIHRRLYTLALQGTADEYVKNPGWGIGNAAFVETMGAPTAECLSCPRGPLPAGIFARDTADVEEAGRSYYGVSELSGNLLERVVTVGNAAGRRFDGRHGDGTLSQDGYAAGPDISTWPGAQSHSTTWSVRDAAGTGMRGGGWDSADGRLRVSDRAGAAVTDSTRRANAGYRFGRTDPSALFVVPPDSAAAADSIALRR